MGSFRVPFREASRGRMSKISTPSILPRISRRSTPVDCSRSVGTVPGWAPGPTRSSMVLTSAVAHQSAGVPLAASTRLLFHHNGPRAVDKPIAKKQLRVTGRQQGKLWQRTGQCLRGLLGLGRSAVVGVFCRWNHVMSATYEPAMLESPMQGRGKAMQRHEHPVASQQAGCDDAGANCGAPASRSQQAGADSRRIIEVAKVRRRAGATAARRATATAERCRNMAGGRSVGQSAGRARWVEWRGPRRAGGGGGNGFVEGSSTLGGEGFRQRMA